MPKAVANPPPILIEMRKRPLLIRLWNRLFRRKRTRAEREWCERASIVLSQRVDRALNDFMCYGSTSWGIGAQSPAQKGAQEQGVLSGIDVTRWTPPETDAS